MTSNDPIYFLIEAGEQVFNDIEAIYNCLRDMLNTFNAYP